MPWTECTHRLLDTPECTAASIQRSDFILLAVGGSAHTVENPIAGWLQQNQLIVLTELGQALDCSLLVGQRRLIDPAALKPVELVGKVDDDIRADVVEQMGQTGLIAALARGARREETDILLGTKADERLAQGIAAAQQHQAHLHEENSLERTIVVEAVVVGRRLLRGRLGLGLLRTCCLLRLTLRAPLTRAIHGTTATTTEQLHGAAHVDPDLRGIELDAIPFPPAGQPTPFRFDTL